jgi:hypothetical protein
MKALITQSNYIPWKGFFDAIALADVVVLYDEMQYTKRDWRNRNKIKTPNGLQWLSIPVQVKGKYHQKINETKTSGDDWQQKHWNSLLHNYKKAPFFDEFATELEQLYLQKRYEYLSDVNRTFIEQICRWLHIDTEIRWSREFKLTGDKSEKLLNICKELNATEYLSGPLSKNYLEVSLFEQAGINVHWLDYEGYPEYSQLHGPFEHGVTVLDLLFNTGNEATKYLKFID